MRIKYHGFTAEISEKDYKWLCERHQKRLMEAMGWKEGEYYCKD